ncbi:MAG: tetratricopeptide repeat protein [Gammaproteobacteria bacterium]|nr:tetratricopeptide repeat protein [Gammaproteobacteria bacterium]MDH3560654.1 tetratricopeptide repeat protein [Gammaproteobacteria bacterium]
MGMIENLQALLANGQDNALLRFSLGSALLKRGDAEQAVEHLAQAVRQDPEYSAAWKVYGKALQALGEPAEAIHAYASGIAAAERKGDKQAAKEMQVFLRRLQKAAGS